MNAVKSFLSREMMYIFLILGTIGIIPKLLLIINKLPNDYKNPELIDFIAQIAQVAFASGVFSAVTKSAHFKSVFIDTVSDVFYGNEHLKSRSQEWLEDIWKRISKTLYQNRFSDISPKISANLLDAYFPSDCKFYYEDYHITWSVKECKDLNGYIELTEEVDAKIRDIEEKALYDVDMGYYSIEEVDNNCEIKLEELTMDGKRIPLKDNQKDYDVEFDKRQNLYRHTFRFSVPLPKRKKDLSLHRKSKKIYPLISLNKILMLNFKRFANKVHVVIAYPSSKYNIDFVTTGSLSDFVDVSEEQIDLISKRYDEMIFPRQGFLFMIDEK